MALRKRHGPAPYQVMRALPSVPTGSIERPAPRPGIEVSPSHARSPIVLRVPRGYAVMMLIGVAGLIVLAYWVGRSAGGGSAEAPADGGEPVAWDDSAADTPARDIPPEILLDNAARAPTARTAGPTPAGGKPPVNPAPAAGNAPVPRERQVGLNYLVLARLSLEECQRLDAFLGRHGVDAAVIPTDNARSFHVIGLRGFTREEMNSSAFDEYKKLIRRLGRQWKDQEKGPTDLADAWAQKYTGKN